jgi:hypothetical protein
MVGDQETKFCTNCQTHQIKTTGKFYWAGKIKRWKCIHCFKTIFNANLIKRNMIARHKTEDLCVHKTVLKEEDARVRIGEEI